VPGRIFRLNRVGSSLTNDRIKNKKKVFPTYFSQKSKTLNSNDSHSDASRYLDMSMSSTISGGVLGSRTPFNRSPFRSFDAKRGSPDKTKLVQKNFKKLQDRLALKDFMPVQQPQGFSRQTAKYTEVFLKSKKSMLLNNFLSR